MRTIAAPERRARLARRHHLAPSERAASPVRVSDDLVGVHATDPVSVFIGFAARTRDVTPADLERALYEERSLLRVLGMRRTMFVVSTELAGVVDAACTRQIAAGERKRVLQMLAEAGVAKDAEAWLARVETATLAALERRREATAADLTRDVPELGIQIPFGEGKKWAGRVGVSTRMLFLLASEGRVVRGRPRGTWVSSQYRWATMERWTGGLPSWRAEEAREELLRRWLRAYGPGTEADLAWWSGWTLGELRRTLARVRPLEIELEGGGFGYVLPDDVEGDVGRATEPWAALLPALDTTVMGWKERAWFLGLHGERLFDRNGNAGPTVWWCGRVVGGWTQRRDGEIATRLLEDVGREARDAIDAAAERLREWLGPVRFKPRFRTPLEQELGA